jgi:hypothetical protein
MPATRADAQRTVRNSGTDTAGRVHLYAPDLGWKTLT